MSCAESCSADSGARNPATARTLVATGAGGAGGGDSGAAGEGAAAVESGVDGPLAARFSIGGQAASTRSAAYSSVTLMRSSSRRLRLFQLLLASLDHLVRRLGRHLLVRVELLPVRAAAVRERVQRRRIAVELRLRHQRPDLGEPAVLGGAEDLT